MDFLTTAKGMEMEGIRYYTDLANKAAVKGLSGIFTFLANQEKEHLKIFQTMEKKDRIPPFDTINILEKAKEQFLEISKHFDTIHENSFDRREIYEKAIELEDKSISFYQHELDEIDDEEQSLALRNIIKEEKKHKGLIKAIIEFQQSPLLWLENAEWNHLDEY